MGTLEIRSLTRAPRDGASGAIDVSLEVRDGRICALLGPSRSGKSDLLRCLAGLERPDAGDVLVDGLSIRDRPPQRRGVGLMFQDLALFPDLSVRENIAFGLRMVGWPRAEREQRVSDLLEVVGLAGLGTRRIEVLTPGEQQRVALARTLAPQPGVLLLDEPLGAIDEVQKAALRLELRSILQALETTAIIATHDLRDAIAIADDLAVIHRGRILQDGPVASVLGEPDSVEVAEIAGYVTLAHGAVRRGRVEEAAVGAMPVPNVEDGDAARVMAHPATLLAVPAESGLGSGVAGLVVRSRPQGPAWAVDLSLGGRIVEARWEWDLAPPREGTRLAIAARPGTLRVFSTSIATLPAPTVPAPTPASTAASTRDATPVVTSAADLPSAGANVTAPHAPPGEEPSTSAAGRRGRVPPVPGRRDVQHPRMPLH